MSKTNQLKILYLDGIYSVPNLFCIECVELAVLPLNWLLVEVTFFYIWHALSRLGVWYQTV